MANIKVKLGYPIKTGVGFTFHAPCDCSEITGLTVVHPGGTDNFSFMDAHGNILSDINHLFAAGSLVKVVLDCARNGAAIQNADTNAYLEQRLTGVDVVQARVDELVAMRPTDGNQTYTYVRGDQTSNMDVDGYIITNGAEAHVDLHFCLPRLEAMETIYWSGLPEHLIPLRTVEILDYEGSSGLLIYIRKLEDGLPVIQFSNYSEDPRSDLSEAKIVCTYPLANIFIPELADIRVDANGDTHASAGAAVRSGASSGDAVLYTPQTLTTEQKAQARANIGAAQWVPVPIVDAELDATSGNPIANSAVAGAIAEVNAKIEGSGGTLVQNGNINNTGIELGGLDGTGAETQHETHTRCDDYIPVFGGETIYAIFENTTFTDETTRSLELWLYDKDKAIISGHHGLYAKNLTTSPTLTREYTLPENCAYIRFRMASSGVVDYKVGFYYSYYTATTVEEYAPPVLVDVADLNARLTTVEADVDTLKENGEIVAGELNRLDESIRNLEESGGGESFAQVLPTGKNLLNRATRTVGHNLTETGELAPNGNFDVSDFIPVLAGESYRLSNGGVAISARTICFYDRNKTVLSFASSVAATTIIVAPKSARYVRFSFFNTNHTPSYTKVQFEQSRVVTAYEEFVGKEQVDLFIDLYIPDKSIAPQKTSFFGTKAGGKNLLDRTASEVGKIVTETGELGNSTKNETSDFIPVAYGDNLYISGVPDSDGYLEIGYAIYNENKQVIEFVGKSNECKNPLPIPRHARFVRYTYRKIGTNIQIERGTEATEYEEYIGVPALANDLMNIRLPNDLPYALATDLNPWLGKKLAVDGDSITHDQGVHDYWQFVASNMIGMNLPDSLGLNPANNKPYPGNGRVGIGGSRIANDPVQSTDDPTYSIVLRYQNLPDDADLVMIAGGTNDWAHGNVDLGDFDSTDVHTFNGALNELLHGLKLKYKHIPVVMMTPIKRGTEYNAVNKKGLTQEQFVDAMIAKCRQYGVYCLDMYSNCPLNPQIPELNETFFLPSRNSDQSIKYDENGNILYDATHPNTEGHKIMGRTVAGFIRTLG